jgi:hypothetical protein
VTYYRIGLFDIAMIIMTNGLWLLWVLWRDEKIELPEEPE